MIIEAVFREEAEMNADFGEKVPFGLGGSMVANALKGTAIGTAVSMTDVSPLEHQIGVKLASDTITDFSSVTLTKCGKNLLSYPYERSSITAAGITYTDNGDGTLTVKGTPSYQYGATFMLTKTCPFKNGVTYTFSEAALRAQGFRFSLCYFDKEQNKEMYPDKLYTITWDDSKYQFKHLAIDNGNSLKTVENVVIRPQIEIGTIETEYEPFKAPETVPVNADGTASVVGKGEDVTLMTDTAGVTISAEYNRDLNKAFAEIYQAIATMGAATATIPEEV